MEKANSTDFLSILTQDKPPMFFFRLKNDAAADKLAQTLKELEKDYPLLKVYEFTMDESEKNQELAQHLGIQKTPMLVFYKQGNFNRYKDKVFTKKALATFIGNKANWTPKEAPKRDTLKMP